ncbi:MAG: peptidylprolyl isomerase [Candidatus Moraniibacteriota bacterium]
MNEEKTQLALIKTSLGDIKVELFADSAPKTAQNFSDLAQKGFYNGTKFHRVIKGFMIQAGDPLSKDDSQKSMWGTGGPGYKFNDELSGKEKYLQGTLAMANSGPNTNGSQFFIVTASPGAQLPPAYTVFGKVVSGMDIALKIENVKTAPNDQPTDDVVIYNMELL